LLLKQPFIKITSANWKTRGGVADSVGNYCSQPLQVASNLNELELTINGQSMGKAIVQNGLAEWMVPFKNGINRVEARGYQNGQPFKDSMEINFLLQAWLLADNKTPFKQVNILLGARRYFIDDVNQQVWLPDQAYRAGSWGYIGGKPFKIDGGARLPFGTDKAIAGTENDPVYQTQQAGIEKYCLDVPAGRYELRLYSQNCRAGWLKIPLTILLTPSGMRLATGEALM
jgi:beta-galactosidase